MSLKLYFHPFSSFCQKVLIAFYENDIPFEPHIVDLTNEASRAEFKKIWPIGKFPVLRDEARDWTVPESSVIIEYLAQHYPGKTQLVPETVDPPELRLLTMLMPLPGGVPFPRAKICASVAAAFPSSRSQRTPSPRIAKRAAPPAWTDSSSSPSTASGWKKRSQPCAAGTRATRLRRREPAVASASFQSLRSATVSIW